MTSPAPPKRPYLLRAMHQWISDCGNTPHVIVDAARAGAEIPKAYVKEGKIVLNTTGERGGATAQRGLHDRYIAPEMKDWTRVYRYGHELLLPVRIGEAKSRLFLVDTGAASMPKSLSSRTSALKCN